MTNFVLIFLCISAGVIMSKMNILPGNSYKSINAWILYVALPALSLRFVPEIEWGWQMLLPGISPILIWLGAWLFVTLYAWKKNVDPSTKTALLLTTGLGNTAFLGFPLISAYYGENEIHHAIVFDQVTFLLFSTIAVITVLKTSNEKQNELTFLYILKKVLRFPPFISCAFALIIPRFIDISPINPLLDKLVATVAPLALFSIGLQLKFEEWKKEIHHLSAGLFYKLLLAPFIIFLFVFFIHGSGNLARISVFEAAMPSHITASLLASQYNLNPKLCSLMVGIGIIIGFITTGFWWFLLKFSF